MTRKIRVHVADFETTTTADDCRVWAWGIDTLEMSKWHDGTTIDSFVEHVQKSKSIIYFHNLKFDAMFIMDYMLKHGFTHSVQRTLKPGQFSTLISNMGKMYSMTVKWKTGVQTEFKDSLKKFPTFSVARLAKAFKLPMTKGEIDYHAERPVGHALTAEERDYLKRDVHIVCQAVKLTLDAGMKKLTIGSDSLHEYKKLKGKSYELMYPVFGHHLDAEIRRAYRGGFTYADPRFSGEITRGGVVLDVNSLYPFIMRERVLPYGDPKYVRGLVEPSSERPLTIFSVTFTATIKPHHIPCIQIKNHGMFSPTEYLSVISEPTTLMVTNVDWQLYQDHYDITVLSYGGGWQFNAHRGAFDNYIDKWSKIKAESQGGQREIAKLHLNSLYGKFASNPIVTSKIPRLDDERVKMSLGIEEKRSPVYTPVGVFITSWARDYTIRSAQANYGTFAYADTDSLHLLQDTVPASLEVDDNKLGAWAHEYDFDAALYVRAKAYLERHADGTYTNRIAGLPTNISEQLRFEDIYNGNVFHGKLVPKSVPGGVVLVDSPYELKM